MTSATIALALFWVELAVPTATSAKTQSPPASATETGAVTFAPSAPNAVMRALPRLTVATASATATATATEASGADARLARVTAKVQRFYDALEDYEARFVQVYTRLATSRTIEQSGTVFIKKGGRVRWDYLEPVKKLFVANGRTLWLYEPEAEQVIVDNRFSTRKLSGALAFLWGEGQLSTSFKIAFAQPKAHGFNKGDLALSLRPLRDQSFKELVVRVDPDSGRIDASVVYETAGNVNRFTFFEPKINRGLSDDRFEFTPPPGVDVVPAGGG